MRLFTRFDRYLARLIALPLLATLVISAMLLLLEKMLKLFDFVVNEGGPVNVVWAMLGNLIPQYLGLGIPIGLLLGILLAFRKLALSSELDALRAVGISYNRLLFVPYLYAAALGLLTLVIVGFIQPYTRYAYEGLQFELRSGALGASIKVGEFAKLGKRMMLRVEESHNQGRDLEGIFVRAESQSGKSLAVSAERGTFLATDDPDVILLRLNNGVLVHNAPGYRAPRVLSFAVHDLPIDLPRIDAFRARGDEDDQERTLPELARVGRDASADPKTRAESIANFHRRLVQVLVVAVLPLLAVALAVPPKRSSSALGVFLSLVIVIVYNEISEYGERLGAAGKADPFIAQWSTFAVFSLLCVWLYYVLAFKPGGQPIGSLDKAFGTLAAKITRLVRRRENWRDDALSAG
ncbi:LPS export ABC transporter permease LptF [Sphingoaurantiacus capsulatus]|uniref:LPS export ABC transporter permease LptF n=1 Tax=Sphingoaurantiacus capsulatus TaxID=1771310 RepID=A0ABV7XDQ6_9SPHN